MKTYLYIDEFSVKEITEQQILDQYWDTWKELIEKKNGSNHFLTIPDVCIDDWVTINVSYEKPVSTSPQSWYDW